jgi:hypothetical protein
LKVDQRSTGGRPEVDRRQTRGRPDGIWRYTGGTPEVSESQTIAWARFLVQLSSFRWKIPAQVHRVVVWLAGIVGQSNTSKEPLQAKTPTIANKPTHAHTHTIVNKQTSTTPHTHTIDVTNGQQPRQQAAIKEAGLH